MVTHNTDSLCDLRIALLGGGVVGGGVIEILRAHKSIQVKIVLVSDLDKERDFSTKGIHFTTDVNEIIDDDSIDIVVDVMGGIDTAWKAVLSALAKEKHVISANKACLATKLTELDEACADRKKMLLFEAAVAGGVPIISIVKRSLATDKIINIGGILNGTTNFILSAMSKCGKDYKEVLAEAQAKGYAEADPTADVDGIDAMHKLMLLSRLAFGIRFDINDVPIKGITEIVADDFEYAALLNCTIKLIAEATLREGDGKMAVSAFVSPVFVPARSALGSCDGVSNEVVVVTSNLGAISCKGPGAGRYPTANSVVSDILECQSYIQNSASNQSLYPHPFNRSLMPESSTGSMFEWDEISQSQLQMYYIRLIVKDDTGIIAGLATTLAFFDVSIHAIHQTPITDHDRVTFCIITEKTTLFNMTKVTTEIKNQPCVLEEPFYCPFRGE